MSSAHLVLVLTAVLAVVALGAAFVAVRAARRAGAAPEAPQVAEAPQVPEALQVAEASQPPEARQLPRSTPVPVTDAPVAKIVDGRVIVPPTTRQIVDVTMSRPLVRLSVLSHGLAHALRPESRDRIVALMRREFQSRRRQRKRAARQAARLDNPRRALDRGAATTEAWLGELPHHTAPAQLASERRAAES